MRNTNYRTDGLCSRCGESPRENGRAMCMPCWKAYSRGWRQLNKAKAAEAQRLWREDPQRRKEHEARRAALKAYPNPQVCEVEGCTKMGERHHDDYDKPLEIRWLCDEHHVDHHVRERLK